MIREPVSHVQSIDALIKHYAHQFDTQVSVHDRDYAFEVRISGRWKERVRASLGIIRRVYVLVVQCDSAIGNASTEGSITPLKRAAQCPYLHVNDDYSL